MTDRQIQTSFAAGELSPNVHARVDLAKYKVGAALLRNWFVDFRGGASTRAGSQFVCQPKAASPGQPRLIPFIVGQQDSYMLLFGEHYIWIIQGGVLLLSAGVPIEVTTPYAAADLPLLKFAQSADVLTLTHPSYAPATLTLASGTFTYASVSIGATIGSPTSLAAVANNSGPYAYGYVVCAVSLDGKEVSLPCAPQVCLSSILDETKGYINNLTWTAPSSPVSLYKIYKWGPLDSRHYGPSTLWGFIGSSQIPSFTDNNIAPDFSQEPPNFGDPFSPGQFQAINIVSGGSGYAAFSYVPLTIVDSGTGTGAAGYGVADTSGVLIGAFLINAGKLYTHATTTVTASGGGATFTFTISSATPLYPAAVSYNQQRLVYGGANTQPETINMSQIANYDNFDTTPVSLATDAINFDIASTQVNSIKAFQPVAYGMIAFTSGGTFLLSGGAPGTAITPSSISAQAQASNGANDMPPIQINYSILYIQNRGNIVRDLSFAWQRQSYTGSDVSTLANHLFSGEVLTEWAWCEEPYKLVWVVRQDGVLLSFSYVPDQEVLAWAHHDTQGWYRSVAAIPEGAYNRTYVIVERFIGGNLQYYVERFDDRIFNFIENSWCLDCALSLGGTAQQYPAPTADNTIFQVLSPTGTTQVYVVSTTDAFVFNSGMVGYTLWDNKTGGKATVTAFVSTTQITIEIIKPFTPVANQAEGSCFLFGGTWSLLENFTTVTGLDHLDGMFVDAVADGIVVPPQICSSGTINLPFPASKVVAGLSYQCQLQSLRIELDGQQTVQGRRKIIPAVTVRVDKGAGLSAGSDFQYLDFIPNLELPYDGVPSLYTGDERVLLQSEWNTFGQICIQQSYPLPATVLGLIPEVLPGDTTR